MRIRLFSLLGFASTSPIRATLAMWVGCVMMIGMLLIAHPLSVTADQQLQFHLTNIPIGKEGSAEQLFVRITGLGLEDLFKSKGAIQSLELRLDHLLLPPLAVYRATVRNTPSAGPMAIVPQALQKQVLECLTPCQLDTEFLWTAETFESILNSPSVKTLIQKSLSQSTWGRAFLKPTHIEVRFQAQSIELIQHTETGWFHLTGPQLKATLFPEMTHQGLQLKGSTWHIHPGGALPAEVQTKLSQTVASEINHHLAELTTLLEAQGLSPQATWQLTWSASPERMLKLFQHWEVKHQFEFVPRTSPLSSVKP
jgi:hypothetical protein